MLTCYPFKQIKKSYVVYGVPLDVRPNADVFAALNGGCISTNFKDAKPAGSELSVVLYMISRLAAQKSTNPADALKSKLFDISAHVNDDSFVIVLSTNMTMSAIGQTFNAVKAGITAVGRGFSAYKALCGSLGIPADRGAFEWALSHVVKGIHKSSFALIGPDLAAEKQKAFAEKLSDIVKSVPAPEGKHDKPSDDKAGHSSSPVEIKTSKMGVVFIGAYLSDNKISYHVRGTRVIPQVPERTWPTTVKHLADKTKVAAFVQKKFSHENTPISMIILSATSGSFMPADLAALPKSYDAATVTNAIVKTLG